MAEKDQSTKEARKQSLLQKMMTTQNTKETMESNKHLAEHTKQLGGILDGLNAVVSSINSVRDSIGNLTNITASMAKVWDAQFDWEQKNAEKEQTEADKEEFAATEEVLETPEPGFDGEPSWLAKLLGKGKEKVQDGNFIEGLVMTVAGLATVFRDEIAGLADTIVSGYDRALNAFNSNLNPFIETQDEIKEQEQQATNDILAELRDGKVATTSQLRELAAAQMKQAEIAKQQEELGRKLTVNEVDDISEQIDTKLEDHQKYNRTKLEEIVRQNNENAALFAKQDLSRIESLEERIAEQRELLANPDYDGPDWMNTEEDKERWKEREEKELAAMLAQLQDAKKDFQESNVELGSDDIEALKAQDEEYQKLLQQRNAYRQQIEEGTAYDQNMIEMLEAQADERIKAIEKSYDRMLEPDVGVKPQPSPADQIKGSTDVLGETNQQIDKATVTIAGISEDDYANMDLSQYGVDVKPTNPSAGTTGGELNTQSKVIDASKQTVVAPTVNNVQGGSTTNTNVVNQKKTSMMPPTATREKKLSRRGYR
jgi:hypothetical protein